jgi:hypothetical protein
VPDVGQFAVSVVIQNVQHWTFSMSVCGGVGMGQWGVRDSYTWAVTRMKVCEGQSLLVQVMGEG